MNDEPQSVDEIKERLKIEVEEEPVKKTAPDADIAGELKSLGRQFAETLQTAWNSEERQRIENEVREGVKSFVDEVDRVFQNANKTAPVKRLQDEASTVKTKVDSSELGTRARSNFVQGLRWMSEELNKLAEKFTTTEREASTTDVDTTQSE